MKRFPLILLHHAGGSAQVFAPLVAALPPEILPIPLDLAGHGRRWREDPMVTASAVLDDIVAQASGHGDEFAIFGHSMGAYLGLALAERYQAGGLFCSVLFASGNGTPRGASPLFPGSALTADDDSVLNVADRYGGIDPRIRAHPLLSQRTAALFRSDFAVCDSFIRQSTRAVIDSRIVVCCGIDDVFTDDQLDEWRHSSTADTVVVRFPGSHNYLVDQAGALAALVSVHLLGQ